MKSLPIFLKFLMGLLLLSGTAYGSLQKKSEGYRGPKDYLSLKDYNLKEAQPQERLKLIRIAFQLPSEKKIQSLKKMPWAVSTMTKMAFDPQLHTNERWQSLISLGKLAPQSQALEKAVQHKDWFVRNAGLLALSQGSRKRALKWSRKLLDDPALVVRSAAVKVIRNLKATEMEKVLWSKLRSKENFKAGEGLWIRKNIVETLGDFAYTGQEIRFIELLHDQDTRVHKAAIQALEKITKLHLEGKTLAQKRKSWLSWWGKKTSSSPRATF